MFSLLLGGGGGAPASMVQVRGAPFLPPPVRPLRVTMSDDTCDGEAEEYEETLERYRAMGLLGDDESSLKKSPFEEEEDATEEMLVRHP